MLDAIAPALAVLEDPTTANRGLTESLAAAAVAARQGAEATTAMVARRGRASYVGDAARGVVDPGALVIAWLFDEAATAARHTHR